MTSNALEYCEKFDRLRELRDIGDLSREVEAELEEDLFELWNALSVSECKEVENRYPDLRIAV